MTERKTETSSSGQPTIAAARRRLEDVKLLSVAASLLAFGGLAATVAVATSSATKTATNSTASPAAPGQLQAPAAAVPTQPSIAAPAPANPSIVSAPS